MEKANKSDQNRIQKAHVLQHCIENFLGLQKRYPGEFSDDPMVTGYLKQMVADWEDLTGDRFPISI